jgi:hypothetical protein
MNNGINTAITRVGPQGDYRGSGFPPGKTTQLDNGCAITTYRTTAKISEVGDGGMRVQPGKMMKGTADSDFLITLTLPHLGGPDTISNGPIRIPVQLQVGMDQKEQVEAIAKAVNEAGFNYLATISKSGRSVTIEQSKIAPELVTTPTNAIPGFIRALLY